MSEKFSNAAKLFRLYFCAPKTKSRSQARIKPKIFVNFRPDPEPDPTYNSVRYYPYIANYISSWTFNLNLVNIVWL